MKKWNAILQTGKSIAKTAKLFFGKDKDKDKKGKKKNKKNKKKKENKGGNEYANE